MMGNWEPDLALLLGVVLSYHRLVIIVIYLIAVPDKTLPAVGWVVSSETCPFYSIGAEHIREVLPGRWSGSGLAMFPITYN